MQQSIQQAKQQAAFEILTWRSAEKATDQEMIEAMQVFSEDVQQLPGFLQQSLYKNAANEWVCIYYWQTEQQAHDSNAAVADKASFSALMALIEADSVTMEVMTALQTSSVKKLL